MRDTLLSVQRYAVRGLRALSALCLALVFLVILANSVQRYGFGKSFVWGEEFAVYMAIYGVMFGAALAYLQGGHVRFTVILQLFPAGVRGRLATLTHAIVALVGIGIAVSGWEFALKRGTILSPGLGMPMHYALAAIPLGGALLVCAGLLRLAVAMLAADSGTPGNEP